ncbi:MAG: hypothetical protein LH614_01115 [Pyrinomonadaceae bacterium]|nr:hypothetical protein [Pyrinomonadaceae bacterium]
MKRTFKERIDKAREAFFEDGSFSPGKVAVRENDFNLQNRHGDDTKRESFDFWAFAKHFLFFLPGVSLLFFVTLVLTDFVIFQNEGVRNVGFAFFWLILGAFMTMFGIGKLAKLKYLNVVASVLLTSFVIALSFFFVPDALQGKFFGSYSLYFLPLVAFVGFLAKKRTDRKDAELL